MTLLYQFLVFWGEHQQAQEHVLRSTGLCWLISDNKTAPSRFFDTGFLPLLLSNGSSAG